MGVIKGCNVEKENVEVNECRTDGTMIRHRWSIVKAQRRTMLPYFIRMLLGDHKKMVDEDIHSIYCGSLCSK